LDLVLLLEQGTPVIKYSDYSWDVALLPPTEETKPTEPILPELTSKQILMKKIDTAQSNLQQMWLETSRLVDPTQIVASSKVFFYFPLLKVFFLSARIFQNLQQEVINFRSTDDMALLELIRDEHFILSSSQKEQLGEHAENAKKILN